MVLISLDHIAHSLMDSIISAFIPVIKRIEPEVESVDMLVSETQDEDEWMRHWHDVHEQTKTTETVVVQPRETVTDEHEMTNIGQKEEGSPSTVLPPRRTWSRFWRPSSGIKGQVFFCLTFCLLALRSAWVSGLRRVWFSGLSSRKKWRAFRMARMKTLMRMSETRRRVTVLRRLLAPKNEVLGTLGKRLVNAADLGAHFGDLQGSSLEHLFPSAHFLMMNYCVDHVLTMQQSLEYYERLLGQSHAAYLSGLNVNSLKVRNQFDSLGSNITVIFLIDHCTLLISGVYSLLVSLRCVTERLFDSRYIQHECPLTS